jgi:hypothetical protein
MRPQPVVSKSTATPATARINRPNAPAKPSHPPISSLARVLHPQ